MTFFIHLKTIKHNYFDFLLLSFCKSNRSDSEILGYALDTLYNIICNDEEEEQGVTFQPNFYHSVERQKLIYFHVYLTVF